MRYNKINKFDLMDICGLTCPKFDSRVAKKQSLFWSICIDCTMIFLKKCTHVYKQTEYFLYMCVHNCIISVHISIVRKFPLTILILVCSLVVTSGVYFLIYNLRIFFPYMCILLKLTNFLIIILNIPNVCHCFSIN